MVELTPVAPEFQVNTFTPNFQEAASVGSLVDGGFVVAWMPERQEPGDVGVQDFGIFAQRCDASGQPIGGEFHVNTTTQGSQIYPSVLGTADGGFLIAYASEPPMESPPVKLEV